MFLCLYWQQLKIYCLHAFTHRNIFNWTLDVSWTAFYESLSSVYPPVRQSVRPLLNFHKTGKLIFSDVVHDDR